MIGIASGDFIEQRIGKRVVVIAEPSVLESAVYELDGTETTLKNYEDYTGVPFKWGEYKQIMLPGYPVYNGMENLMLTF